MQAKFRWDRRVAEDKERAYLKNIAYVPVSHQLSFRKQVAERDSGKPASSDSLTSPPTAPPKPVAFASCYLVETRKLFILSADRLLPIRKPM